MPILLSLLQKSMKKIFFLLVIIFWQTKELRCDYIEILPDKIYDGDAVLLNFSNLSNNKNYTIQIILKKTNFYNLSNNKKLFIAVPLFYKGDLKINLFENKKIIFSKSIKILEREISVSKIKIQEKYIKPKKDFFNLIEFEKKIKKLAISSFIEKDFIGNEISAPLENFIITSKFGEKRFFNGKEKKYHWGVDMVPVQNSNVKAILPGIVIFAGYLYFEGNAIFINHGNGIVSLYCHLDKIFVKHSDFVKSGDIIGTAGKTGRATNVHLHLSLYVHQIPVDPLSIFKIFKLKINQEKF